MGTEEAATKRPSLLEPQEAWVCKYDNIIPAGPPPSPAPVVYRWQLLRGPDPVPDEDMAQLEATLDDLRPADSKRLCTADLGPRWMIVYSHDGDLTGVLVDAFGCRDVRLTDNPHTTPAGTDDQEGTVGGVLENGTAILDALGLARSR